MARPRNDIRLCHRGDHGFSVHRDTQLTGLVTPSGKVLAGFAGLWLAGRILLFTGPTPLASVVDALFLPLVALALGRILYRAGNRRNYFLIAILLALTAFNTLFHLTANGLLSVGPGLPMRWALYLIIVLAAVIGGRVIPFFTVNSLPRIKQHRGAWLDRGAIGSLILALGTTAAGAPAGLTAVLCFGAAILNGLQLAGWRPDAVLRKPILWVLHIAYAWIVVGTALLGRSALGYLAEVFAWHAFAGGALGLITVAMMTHTSRGHTASPMVAGRADVLAYALVLCAGLVRVGGPLLMPEFYVRAVVLAGAMWSLAFVVFAIACGPLLCRPRRDGKPG